MLGRYSYKNFSEFRYNDEDEAVVNEGLKTAGMLEFKDRDMSELSGGERQKVLITLALVQLNLTEELKDKLLIIDEPLTYLDVNYQHEIFSILHKLNSERGLTVLVVMHDLNLALKYTDKTLLLDKGNLIFLGETKDIINEENLNKYFLINSNIIKNNNELLINYLPKL
jgi:iron complex transport system ATP-binding protein